MFAALKNRVNQAYRKFRFRISSNNNPFFVWCYTWFYRPKKGSLSYFLDRYSRHKKGDFTVIQIGANDGINNDPIHKFIKRDHWKGVLLEPQKSVFDDYLSKIYRKDKDIVTLNAALGTTDGTTPIYKIGFSNARWASGLTSFRRDVLQEAFTSGYVSTKIAEENGKMPEALNEQIVTEDVPVITRKKLFDQYSIKKIDLLQIDTEGFDFEIIKMFDFSDIKPQVIVFENMHLSEEERTLCYDYLNGQDYDVKPLGKDTLCTDRARSQPWL